MGLLNYNFYKSGTPNLTEDLIHVRLQNEWIFRKKKQAWKDFHALIMEKNFPPSTSVEHVRVKWSYLLYDYHKAVFLNNTKWIYYDIFDKYLGRDKLKLYHNSNWSDDWIVNLMKIRTHNSILFCGSNAECEEGWNKIEKELRDMGLPAEYSVQKIDEMWYSLIKIFRVMNKYKEDGKISKYVRPFYKQLEIYFETAYPNESENVKRKLGRERSDCDLLNSKNVKDDELVSNKNGNSNFTNWDDGEEFSWTQEWTESFIHMRLQNDDLFQQKKQAWKDFHKIMMGNNFPKSMTIPQIRKKWTYLQEDYNRAVATNNTKWLYYDTMFSYLGKLDTAIKSWNVKWIKRFIDIRIKNNELFENEKLSDDDCWSIIESELRHCGIPSEYTVRKIHPMWLLLIKTFKTKHKYINHSKSNDVWEFYDDMKRYFQTCEPEYLQNNKKRRPDNKETCDESTMNDSIDQAIEFEIPIDCNNIIKQTSENKMKNEIPLDCCRVCLEKSDVMVSLFDSDKNLSSMIMACTSLRLSRLDEFPKQICKTCIEQLNIAFEFKEKCEASDKLMKSLVQHKKEIIKNEIYVVDDMDMCESNLFASESPNFDDFDSETENKMTRRLTQHRRIHTKNIKKYKQKGKIKKTKMKVNESKGIVKKMKMEQGSESKSAITQDKKKKVKSKNVIITPIVTESGETIFKRKYVYWKVCDICGKSSQRMSEHMKGHHNVRSYKCEKCPKTFTYYGNMKLHLRTHDSTPLKICQLCGKEFFRDLIYKRHLLIHANERKFACEQCGKTFNTKDVLRVHIRTHTGERPYSCKVCGKAFYSQGCVTRHQKVHRKITHLGEPC